MRRFIWAVRRLGVYLALAVLGTAVGAFGLATYQGHNGPRLELWHTAELTAEFTAEKANEIRSFEDTTCHSVVPPRSDTGCLTCMPPGPAS